MSTPPPAARAVERQAPQRMSPANAWLVENALLQSINGTVWFTVLVGWVALGSSVGAALLGALVLCIALPIIGWFIGLPIVLASAMLAACLWFMGALAIAAAWACVTATVAAVTFARRLLDKR